MHTISLAYTFAIERDRESQRGSADELDGRDVVKEAAVLAQPAEEQEPAGMHGGAMACPQRRRPAPRRHPPLASFLGRRIRATGHSRCRSVEAPYRASARTRRRTDQATK